MNIQYDADLVETVAFLEARRLESGRQRLLTYRYDSGRAKLYDIDDPDEQTAAFFQYHIKWFRNFGFEDRILNLLKEFPRISKQTATLLLRRSVSKKDEGAELFVRQDAQNVVVALRAEMFIDDPRFDQFLRHEFCHISDMYDETFSYEPDLSLPGAPPVELNLLRDRYRVLWDITISGRLGHEIEKPKAFAELNKAFSYLPEQRRQEIFDLLWSGARPSHPELVELARAERIQARNIAGASCPLCNFPSFHWAEAEVMTSEVITKIEQHFPHWQAEQGSCARCAELYALKPMKQPAPLFL